MYYFYRLQLLIVRRVTDKELAGEMLNDLELLRQGLFEEVGESCGQTLTDGLPPRPTPASLFGGWLLPRSQGIPASMKPRNYVKKPCDVLRDGFNASEA